MGTLKMENRPGFFLWPFGKKDKKKEEESKKPFNDANLSPDEDQNTSRIIAKKVKLKNFQKAVLEKFGTNWPNEVLSTVKTIENDDDAIAVLSTDNTPKKILRIYVWSGGGITESPIIAEGDVRKIYRFKYDPCSGDILLQYESDGIVKETICQFEKGFGNGNMTIKTS